MLKLMKYELRKTAFSKLVLLVITAVAEIAFLIGVLWKKDNTGGKKWNNMRIFEYLQRSRM